MTNTTKELTAADLRHLCVGYQRYNTVATTEEATALVRRAGVMSTWSAIGTLPCLAASLAADADHQVVWQVMENFPQSRVGYYGKVFTGKGTLLAAPVFGQLAGVAGGLDYEQRYADGRLSADARQIAARLATRGELAADELRKASGFGAKEHKAAWDKALTELQHQLLVTPAGQVAGNGNFKTPVWQLSQAWWDGRVLVPADRIAATREVIVALAAAAGVLRDTDVRAWLRPYGIGPQAIFLDLLNAGELDVLGQVRNTTVYARPTVT